MHGKSLCTVWLCCDPETALQKSLKMKEQGHCQGKEKVEGESGDRRCHKQSLEPETTQEEQSFKNAFTLMERGNRGRYQQPVDEGRR